MCQIHGLKERKRGRWHSEWEKMRKIDLVSKKRTPMVYSKYEGNPWGVSTYIGGSRYRYKKECSNKNICWEKNYKFAKDVKITKRFGEKVIKLVDVEAQYLWRNL